MKKIIALMFVMAMAGYGFGQNLSGSAHDFSTETWNSSGEMCVVCHTPHNGAAGAAVLWNHTETTQTFTLYTSSTLDATIGQPSGVSKLCLSCHDGTVALDAFGGAAGSNMISGSGLIGTDLSNDHPISFTYNTALATTDGGLHDPATTDSGLGNQIDDDLLFGTGASKTMECSSCHDVHNSAAIAGLLRKSNAASALCLTCHDK